MSGSFNFDLLEGIKHNPPDNASNTFYSISPDDLYNCKVIWLIMWEDMSPDLTLSNLEKVVEGVSRLPSSKGPWISTRDWKVDEDPVSIPFEFSKEKGNLDPKNPIIFNAIIYMSLSGEPVGYTWYSATQGIEQSTEGAKISKWRIYLNFSSIKVLKEYKLENTLKPHIEETKFVGNLDSENSEYDYLYPTKTSVIRKSIEKYPKYTNYIHHMKFDKSNVIVNGNKYISNSYYGKLEINPLTLTYDNIKICMYEEDLVAVEWDKENYKVTSLLILDENERNYVYRKGDYTELGIQCEIVDATPMNIICKEMDTYVNGVLKPGQETLVFNTKNKSLLRKGGDDVKFIYNPYLSRPGFVVDNRPDDEIVQESSRDDSEEGTVLSSINRIKSEEFIQYINSSFYHSSGESLITNENYDIGLGIKGFVGTFIIMNTGDDGDTTRYVNVEGQIILKTYTTSTIINEDGSTSSKTVPNPIFVINDNCLMEKKPNSLVFYFTDSGSSIDYKGTSPDNIRLRHTIGLSDTRNQLIDGFRKNPITYSVIPDIIATFGGILFYKDKNNVLRYL